MINVLTSYYFPNKLGRILLFVFEEVLGKTSLDDTLNLSLLSKYIDNFPKDNNERTVSFETIGLLQNSLEQKFGHRGARGLALRAGRIFFSQIVRIYGSELRVNEPAFRLKPLDVKLVSILHILKKFFNEETDQKVVLEETDQYLLWRIERCPWCWKLNQIEPTCHFAIGILQEALFWVSAGKFYNIVEKTCIAQGDSSCLIVIDKIPLC